MSPTGSGKTLCFQLPAVLQDRLSLVVSPLKALMSQQVSDLLGKKIPATFINGDLSKSEKTIRYDLLANNALKFLYVAPERFYVRSAEERASVLGLRPAYMVIDEAHCVDQWGQDFRPEYGRLGDVRRSLGSPSVLAFTATAGTDMQQRILSSLGIEDARVFVRDVDRPNILLVRRKQDPDKRALEISQLLRLPQLKGGKAMVFVPSVRVGEKLVAALAELGLEVPIYHSNLGTPWDREQLLKRFAGESQPACDHIICTSAFGMGLDIPNVRLTIHWQHPATVEDLLQEFGRAGRDGKPSVSVIFHNGRHDKRDAARLKFMAEKTIESSDAKGGHANKLLAQRIARIDQVAGMLAAGTCFRRQILNYFEGTAATRISLSERILDWVFGSRARRNRGTRCCDYCDRERIKKIGVREYVAGAL